MSSMSPIEITHNSDGHKDSEFIDKKTFLAWVAEVENKFKNINFKLVLLMERTDGFIDKIKSIKDLKKSSIL